MSFNFPTGAAVGQEYVTGAGITYVYNGYGWVVKANDAPIDGKTYGRKDATWAEIVSDVTKSYVDTQDALRVLKTGDTMTGGLKFGSDVASAATDVSRHISLHGSGYGFSITPSTLNVVTDNVVRLQLDPSFATVYPQLRLWGGSDRVRWRGDGFSVITHHNNDDFYFMVTDVWNPDAGWNGLRPIRLNRGGSVNMGHTLTAGVFTCGGLYGNGGGSYWSTTYGGGSSALEVRSGSGDWDSYMTFHIPGSFACNFGLKYNNWNLYYGGNSFGQGNEWMIWTTRNFGGQPVVDGRLAYAGDIYHGNEAGVTEPYGGAAGTGAFSYGGGLRYRYMQLHTTGWYTIGYA